MRKPSGSQLEELSRTASGDHLREATGRDIPVLARLFIQLYAHELPGMLRGDAEAQAEFGRRMLAAAPLGCLYVLERDGAVVAMGSLATQEQPEPDTPAKIVLQAPLIVGPVNGARTIMGAVRALLSRARAPEANQAHIHSVVVDAAWRGQGLGTVVLRWLEQEALRRGKKQCCR